ncbi:MAG TPA: glycosyltransferase family 2 protein [Solirubrobacterales bacterium]|nr:glycosyltransferase family 2 protein [Solirubrobacterales bacterium]
MDVTVIVGTFGGAEWVRLAHERAVPSGEAQAPVIHRHAASLAQARNEGAALAKTEWLCFLDADDELEPGYFEAMERATADLRGPAVSYVRHGRPTAPKLWPAQDLRDGNFLVIGTLIRKELFERVGGFKEWPIYEDWCVWQRCAAAGATVEQVPDAVYVAHVRAKSRNRQPSRAERLRWHHEIRQANHPELYEVAA